MRRRCSGVLLALVATVGLLTACGGSSSSGSAIPSAGSSSGGQASVVKKCRDVHHEIATDTIEREPLIPCSERHNVEVVGTWPLYGKATREAIEQYGAHCFADEEDTFGIRTFQVYRTQVAAVGVPTKPGHVQVQCEVWLLPGIGDDGDGPATVTYTSLAQQAGHGDHAGTTWCTDAVPTAAGSRFVDCGEPHLAQAQQQSVFIDATGDLYPAAAIQERGQAACESRVSHLPNAAGLTSFTWWWSRSIWEANGKPAQVPGACWYFRKDHRPLPAIK